MRKVILGAGLSVDGYIARPNGSVDFLAAPEDYSMEDLFSSVDVVLFGRKTFDAAQHLGGAPQGAWTMYVFSRSQPPGKRSGVVFVNDSPADFIARLRRDPGKDIFHMGGGELARAFLQADLIDELHLDIVPLLLGEGIPLFPAGFPQRDFRLIENKTYSGGFISIKYERVRASTTPPNRGKV